MLIVKVLGAIDLIAALAFLMLVFGISPFIQLIVFSAGLLFLKGLFIFGGEPLSAIDLGAAILLFLSIPLNLPAILLWIPAFLLVAKAMVSFL